MGFGVAREDSLAGLFATALDRETIAARTRGIGEALLGQSRHVRSRNFTVIHARDLEFLFAAYDREFFEERMRPALAGRPLTLRLAPRMTRAGGTTTRRVRFDGREEFEIAVAVSMLFDQFGDGAREVTACGLECGDRLDALQRIFEHELVHLGEYLCYGSSDCSARRFQTMAHHRFHHTAHTHALVTRREQAARIGVGIGTRVRFEFEGRTLRGRVNRVTKRATVLVEDPTGRRYSDGKRYRVYYVPLEWLQPE